MGSGFVFGLVGNFNLMIINYWVGDFTIANWSFKICQCCPAIMRLLLDFTVCFSNDWI